MPDEAKAEKQDEYAGLTTDQIAALKRNLNAVEISRDFCDPYFSKFQRMENLYSGVLPEELDGTFSKVMLRTAASTVHDEVPRSCAALFSTDDFFQLYANDYSLEYAAESVTKWLRYQLRTKNRVFPRIVPTIQRVAVFGVGYRIVTHDVVTRRFSERRPGTILNGVPYNFRETERVLETLGIFSQNVNVYSIMPSPTGGLVNAHDNETEACADWVCWIDYISESRLKSTKAFNQEQVKKMIESKSLNRGNKDQIDDQYRQGNQVEGSNGVGPVDWMDRIRQKGNLVNRYRCVWTFFRDRWILVGAGKYLLYDGPPSLDWIPLAKYVDTPHFDDWFGTGVIEMTEDLILSMLLQYNMRQDYLIQTIHPTKFVRDDILESNGGALADFDPIPFSTFRFSKKIQDIQKAIWYDRFPEISPQAFMEDTKLSQLMQEMTGHPNYMKGMGGEGTLANETATGIVNLIDEGTTRTNFRSIMMEYTGLHDELMLFLKYGKKYRWQDEKIRVQGQSGWPWSLIPSDAIDDGYMIELVGTRGLYQKNEVMKRIISLMPFLLNNPAVPNQKSLVRQATKKFDVFDNVDDLFGTAVGERPMEMISASGAPGAGGQRTLQNERRSVTGRMTPQPGGRPAEPAMIQ